MQPKILFRLQNEPYLMWHNISTSNSTLSAN